ncbi:MAG TPA: hypothetical protein PKC18_16090 [Lacipirellulaceae bacterium]|nr:hypothetical protein [Lacipirellulaceae bacterium]
MKLTAHPYEKLLAAMGEDLFPDETPGESKEQRCQRVLAGVPLVKRASDPTAFTFDYDRATAAHRRAEKAREGSDDA